MAENENPDVEPEAVEAPAPVEEPSAAEAGVPHVEDAAPDDLDADPASSTVTDEATTLDLPATMQEQKAPKLEGEAERRGYFGETAADRAKAEKATLAESLKVQTNAEAVAAVPNENQEN